MRDTVRPKLLGCPGRDGDPLSINPWWPAFFPRMHQWHYRSWNGNDRHLLSWFPSTRGIPRKGWRCYHCGRFVWDQTDPEFALSLAYYTHRLPDALAAMVNGRFVAKEEEV